MEKDIFMLRQQLGALMAVYAERFKLKPSEVKARLYEKYGINSRTKLSTEHLEKEIESYRFALATESD